MARVSAAPCDNTTSIIGLLRLFIAILVSSKAPCWIEHFGVLIGFATTVDARQVLEEQPGAVEERQQRTISITGQRIKPGFNIGEVRAKESRHIAVKPPSV